MRLIFFIIFFTYSLFAITPKEAVSFAKYAYSNQHIIKQKFDSKYDKVIFGNAKSVPFYLLENDSSIIISFRGSDRVKNWVSNTNIFEEQFLDYNGSKVHQGFFSEAKEAIYLIEPIISKNKKIFIVGHSLGGAVALATGAYLYDQGFDVEVFSFGSPPVGNQIFVDQIQNLKHNRYVHELDIVPHLNKNLVGKLQKGLEKLKDSIEIDEIQVVLELINIIPYNYVHHSVEKTLLIEPITPEKFRDINFVLKLLLLPIFAHDILTYEEAVNAEK